MGCCGNAGAIVQGYGNLVIRRQYIFTAQRRLVCRKCILKKKVWGVGLFCIACKCFIEAKIRAKKKTCDKWEQ